VPSQLLLGILLTVVSAFGFGSGALFAKPVYAAGVDWHTLMTWRFTLGAALSWAWVLSSPGGRAAVTTLGRRAISVAVALGILLARLFPTITLVIPFFVLAFLLRLLDTHILLILIYLTFNVPFVVWAMRAYFDEVPKEIEEAALVDGCTRFTAFTRCILPAARPGLFATGVMCFILAWNEFNYALFLTSRVAKTVPTAIAFFRTERGILWGEVSALGVIAILPVLVIAALAHNVLLRGFSLEGSQQ